MFKFYIITFAFIIFILPGCTPTDSLTEAYGILSYTPDSLPQPIDSNILKAIIPEYDPTVEVSPYAGRQAPGGQNEYALWRFDDFYNTEPNSLDWVFIGSSHSYCTFDPANFDTLGIKSFQLGMPRQLVDGTYFTLLEILNYHQPATAVLDLYWYVLETEFDREQVETYLNVIRNEELKQQYREEMAPLYTARGIELTNYIQEGRDTEGEFYKGRGYVYMDKTKTVEQFNEIAQRPYHEMADWVPHPRQEYFLEKIAELCAEKGIRLIITTAPVSNVYVTRIKNYEVMHNYIADFAERHGLLYLDYIMENKARNFINDVDFFDAGHLNGRAIKRMNEYFINWLFKQENGIN